MTCADPHAFILHLQDRLAAVAADALRLATAHCHDLPPRFGDAIALAADALRVWEQDTREGRAELEYGRREPVRR
jgi:hypothetical protein